MDDYWTAPADARITEFGEGYTETYGEWRLRQWREDADAHVKAWRRSAPYEARPFRFEDLNGRPEPTSWGPKYSKPIAKPRAWNDETNIPTNCASGQKRCFDAAKHRAKIRAEFAATAARECREWALGKSKNCQGLTIKQAYALAMKEKRGLLEALELEEAA
jgi:hypothetical protein